MTEVHVRLNVVGAPCNERKKERKRTCIAPISSV